MRTKSIKVSFGYRGNRQTRRNRLSIHPGRRSGKDPSEYPRPVQRENTGAIQVPSAQEIQVLAPMHKGTIGVTNLNIELQKRLNPGPSGITRGAWNFRLGDKVMQVINNYDKDVFNGDIGWISKIDPEERQ